MTSTTAAWNVAGREPVGHELAPAAAATWVTLNPRAFQSRTTASAAAKRPGLVSCVGLRTSSVMGFLASGRYQPSSLCSQPGLRQGSARPEPVVRHDRIGRRVEHRRGRRDGAGGTRRRHRVRLVDEPDPVDRLQEGGPDRGRRELRVCRPEVEQDRGQRRARVAQQARAGVGSRARRPRWREIPDAPSTIAALGSRPPASRGRRRTGTRCPRGTAAAATGDRSAAGVAEGVRRARATIGDGRWVLLHGDEVAGRHERRRRRRSARPGRTARSRAAAGRTGRRPARRPARRRGGGPGRAAG